MKFSTYFLFLISLLTCCNLFGQIAGVQNQFDSSFTLTKHLAQDKSCIGQHGVFFNETTKQVFKDFNHIATLSLTDLANYQRQVMDESNHIIKIWTTNDVSKNVSKIIEINSTYFIDTTDDDGERFKDTIFYNDYFIQLKDTSKNVCYETIKRQGVSKYSIGNRQVWTNREMILVGLFYVDNNREIKQLLDKYNPVQQRFWQ